MLKLIAFLPFFLLSCCVSTSKKDIPLTQIKAHFSYKKGKKKEALSARIFISDKALRIDFINPLVGSLASLIEEEEGVLLMDQRRKLFLRSSLKDFPLFKDLNLPPLTLTRILKEDLSSFSCKKKGKERLCSLGLAKIKLKGKPLKSLTFKGKDQTLKIKLKKRKKIRVKRDFFNPSLKGWKKSSGLSLEL